MKFVHETVIQRRKILQAIGAVFFEPFEKEYLHARIQLFNKQAQLGHGITSSGDTQDIVHKPLNKLLSNIFTGQISIRDFSLRQKLFKWYSLRSKWNWLLVGGYHAESAPSSEW